MSDESIEGLLDEVASGLAIQLNRRQHEQLQTYFSLLLKWNERVNLTSIRDPKEIAVRHFEESLFLAKLLPAPHGLVVDIGSGAGFPGLPLKIAWPEVQMSLLEPNQKKATFLKEVIRLCGLERTEVRAERLESAATGPLRQKAALATMRAVAPTPQALADAEQLLTAGGQLALFTSEKGAKKIAAPGNMQWQQRAAIPVSQQRVILIFGSHAG
jgi:16S rRNA (guanine527-N7)-methyltransferase